MNDTTNFRQYGHDFQLKAITCIFTDKYFLSQVIDDIRPDYFESDANQYLCEIICKYYKQYKETPSKEVIAVEVTNIKDPELKSQCKATMRSVGALIGSKDLDYIKDSIKQFCRNQEMTKALYKSIEILPSGNFEHIYEVIGKALNVGTDTNLGHDYQNNFADRYSIEFHNPVPTPWKAVNDKTKGGPGRGHLCVIMAGPGIGKSWCLAYIGAVALKEGKTVLHYTMELGDIYVGRRYDSILSGIPIDDLDSNTEFVERKVKEVNKGKLIIRNYYSYSITTHGLQGHLEKCGRMDIKPDIIIVDYADLMRLSGKGELRHQIDMQYCDLRRIGGEYECPVWTASQLNKEGYKQEHADGDTAAEAFAKNNAPDVIITFSRPVDLRDEKVLYGFISKNRLGPDKVKMIGEMDGNTGISNLYDYSTPEADTILQSIVPTQNTPEFRNRMFNQFINRNESTFNGSLG